MQNNLIAVKPLIQGFFQLYPEEAARILNQFSTDQILVYLQNEPIARALQIFLRLNPELAAGLIEKMDENLFIRLCDLLDPSHIARLLARIDEEIVKDRILLMAVPLANEVKEIMTYPKESAGYLMDAKISVFYPEDTVEEVLNKIRKIKDRRIVNINVTYDDGRLVGVIPLQHIAVSDSDVQLKDLMHGIPITIQSMSPQEEVVQLLDENKLLSLPVVDFEGKLLGVIRHDALLQAAKQDATEDVQAMFGAGREEQALSKASYAIRKRLPWLEINLATAFLAAAVVGLFEDTIAKITVLAVFLPVVAGQSGNTGSQALAVTMRGLALREIRGRHWFRVARKEITVGFVNGCVVALTTSMIVYLWESSLGLAAVIAVAMVISMVIAGFFGAVIPIILKAFGQDPAQSSSIILTTVTDVVGFMSFLGLATLLVSSLNIN
jgi:magnesium transporter